VLEHILAGIPEEAVARIQMVLAAGMVGWGMVEGHSFLGIWLQGI